MRKSKIIFVKVCQTLKQLKTWSPKGGLLVLDDLMVEGGNDKEVLDLFTKHSHHRNITVVCLRQDMFLPGKYFKSISRNSHHIVTFRNPRNQLGMRNVSSQAFPKKWQEVMNVYRKTTERPFGSSTLDHDDFDCPVSY